MTTTTTHRSSLLTTAAAAFTLGYVAATIITNIVVREKRSKSRKYTGASSEGNDHSLFYDDDVDALTTVKEFLPSEFYGQMVRDCIICCVDCVVIRNRTISGKKKQRECLLVERADEPAKGLWWLPGGRIYKGETFFTAAKRKCLGETGVSGESIQVLGVYNTFFPRSSHDSKESRGTQTVNVVVLVQIDDNDSKVILDATSKRHRWLPIDIDEDQLKEEDKYVFIQLKRMEAWNSTFGYK